jgi:hypothetical protein
MPSFSLVAAVATASDNAPLHTPVFSSVLSETAKAKRKRTAEAVDITRLPCQVRPTCFPPHTLDYVINLVYEDRYCSNFPA